tara:strand:+ start:450 stop:797 length:348 start_codon:yes stop_codon:yes gene_type:complete
VTHGEDLQTTVIDDGSNEYCFLYDTLDGHKIRVPLMDKQYMLAKVRPVQKGDRAKWVKIPGREGLTHYASGGSTPAYTETLPAELLNRKELVAPVSEVKSGRRRKRGKRGRRKDS